MGSRTYVRPVRELLRHHGDSVVRALARYDQLADHFDRERSRARSSPTGSRTEATRSTRFDGVVLIDWDTALLAPRERDLWALIDEDPTIAEVYSDEPASRSRRA